MTLLLFPGQGAQEVGMGLDLAEKFPVARETLDEARGLIGAGRFDDLLKGVFDAYMRLARGVDFVVCEGIEELYADMEPDALVLVDCHRIDRCGGLQHSKWCLLLSTDFRFIRGH